MSCKHAKFSSPFSFAHLISSSFSINSFSGASSFRRLHFSISLSITSPCFDSSAPFPLYAFSAPSKASTSAFAKARITSLGLPCSAASRTFSRASTRAPNRVSSAGKVILESSSLAPRGPFNTFSAFFRQTFMVLVLPPPAAAFAAFNSFARRICANISNSSSGSAAAAAAAAGAAAAGLLGEGDVGSMSRMFGSRPSAAIFCLTAGGGKCILSILKYLLKAGSS
mmetsp:Transcript_79201/g.154907  ORF Transcript_79201/g.154907 Transcript_79201/m.154907 type:complete len:225 (+) Transcript_79201:2076-2750(+)